MKFLSKFYIGLVFLLLYIPIIVLIVFSFNESGSLAEFSKFSFVWYEELFHDEEAFSALRNSLVLAVSSSLIATVLGTFGALGLYRMKSKAVKKSILTVTNIPMMNPDIVTGVSMMLLFVALAGFLKTRELFGFGTLLIAHVTFNIPYVILSVMPLTLSGVVSGVTMVFVPSISTFYISQKLGAGKIDLVGDTIERLFQNVSTYNVGAAMSLVMMILILISLTIMNKFSDEEGGMVP